jgi:hypothetical protein
MLLTLGYGLLTGDQHTGSYGCTKEACQFRDAVAGEWYNFDTSRFVGE